MTQPTHDDPHVYLVIHLPGPTLPSNRRPAGEITAVFDDETRARNYAVDVRGVVAATPIIADYRTRPQQEAKP
jgi:hypothetical protein